MDKIINRKVLDKEVSGLVKYFEDRNLTIGEVRLILTEALYVIDFNSLKELINNAP